MQIPPRTQYLRRDGLSLAYQVFGDGPPLIVAPSVPSPLDLMWIDPGYTQILRRFGSFARVVMFDPCGTGLSDPVDHVPTLEEAADDIEAVMDAAGVRQAVLFASGNTCPNAAMFAGRAPDRVRGLVLFMPYAQGSRAEGAPERSSAGTNGWPRRWRLGTTRSRTTGERDARWRSSRPASAASGCGGRGACSSGRRRARP